MSAICALCNYRLDSYTHAEECAQGIVDSDNAAGRVASLQARVADLEKTFEALLRDVLVVGLPNTEGHGAIAKGLFETAREALAMASVCTPHGADPGEFQVDAPPKEITYAQQVKANSDAFAAMTDEDFDEPQAGSLGLTDEQIRVALERGAFERAAATAPPGAHVQRPSTMAALKEGIEGMGEAIKQRTADASPDPGCLQVRKWRNRLREAAEDADWREVDGVRQEMTAYLARDGEPCPNEAKLPIGGLRAQADEWCNNAPGRVPEPVRKSLTQLLAQVDENAGKRELAIERIKREREDLCSDKALNTCDCGAFEGGEHNRLCPARHSATIEAVDVDDVLDALAASVADGEIDYDDVTTPEAAREAAIELLREVRLGLALDPSSNKLRREPALVPRPETARKDGVE